jgi:ABC-type lipoprotein release transport system permease subunit
MSERETRGVQLVGIEPQHETISFLASARFEGEPLADGADRRIIVGAALAEQLETATGRRLVIITQGADGLNRETGYRVAGLFDAEGTALEKSFVFTGLEGLQDLLDADVVTEVSVRLDDEQPLDAAKRALAAAFGGLDVLDWRELEPQAATMFAFADAAIFIWFLILMGALVFGLVNTLVTSVMERVREFGMLRAVGMRAGSVVAQVVIESSTVMAAGVLIGLALGVLLQLWLADGIDLSQWAEGMEMAGMRSTLVPIMRVADLVLVATMSMALGLLASLYPAWRATRIKPLEALRR